MYPPVTIHVDEVGTTRKGWLSLTDLQTNENLTLDRSAIEFWSEFPDSSRIVLSLTSGRAVVCQVRTDADADPDAYLYLIEVLLMEGLTP